MATTKPSKRALLAEFLAGRTSVTEADWALLHERLAPISESYLRKLLRSSNLPLAPLVEGVRQESLEELERTLVLLAREYEAGDRARSKRRRELVIQAKDHARWAARRGKPGKDEMISWMQIWLDNPALFPIWVKLRKKAHEPQTTNH